MKLIDKLNKDLFKNSRTDHYTLGYLDALSDARSIIREHLSSPEVVEQVALRIHQCYYHPVDWNTKEQLGMFKREKILAISKAKAALEAI